MSWYLIKTDGAVEKVSDDKPALSEMQKLVGGYIEAVPGNHEAYCNEEGLYTGLASNPHASSFLGWPNLVGDILVEADKEPTV